MTDPSRKIIIAIDGYASCGKSTVAKELARLLQYNYVDSGAMYRAVTLFALRNSFVDGGKLNEKKMIQALGDIHLSFQYNALEKKSDILLNGENVEKEIRDLEVSAWVSPVATIKEVRREMVRQQQAFGKCKGIVMDGRDIGTVVFPDAELKIFMTALPEIRAQRRFEEMKAKGIDASFEEILVNVLERDHIDRTRQEGPLKQAADALVLDNSSITREEQLQWIVNQVNRVLDAHHN
jgi:CMP/dCMP kinase